MLFSYLQYTAKQEWALMGNNYRNPLNLPQPLNSARTKEAVSVDKHSLIKTHSKFFIGIRLHFQRKVLHIKLICNNFMLTTYNTELVCYQMFFLQEIPLMQ